MRLTLGGPGRPRLLVILAVTQVASWGSLYYAYSVLAPAMQGGLGLSKEWVLGAFTGSILVSGVVAPWVGRALDRWGGRPVMAAGSAFAGLGCLLLGWGTGPAALVLAWVLLGLGMAGTLYDAAFATIVQDDPPGARKTISLLTLFGGLASTVFWPLTSWLQPHLGWQGVYLVYGLLHLGVCLPLHLGLPPRPNAHGVGQPPRAASRQGALLKETLGMGVFWALALAFSCNSFLFAALSIHLIPLLQAWDHPVSEVLWMTALIGPMQVAGRIAELSLNGRFPVDRVGLVPFGLLPLALVGLLFLGPFPAVAVLFCCLYGVSNGLMTIVRGVLVKERFDPGHYGLVSGLLTGFGVVFRAVGPLVVGLLLGGGKAWGVTTFLLGVSLVSLVFFLGATRRKA